MQSMSIFQDVEPRRHIWDSRGSGSELLVPENSDFGSDQRPTRVRQFNKNNNNGQLGLISDSRVPNELGSSWVKIRTMPSGKLKKKWGSYFCLTKDTNLYNLSYHFPLRDMQPEYFLLVLHEFHLFVKHSSGRDHMCHRDGTIHFSYHVYVRICWWNMWHSTVCLQP